MSSHESILNLMDKLLEVQDKASDGSLEQNKFYMEITHLYLETVK